ncbi:hypothetical protein [Desulfatirhabdium butyrativorans]|uniref:hypothetical protein n=1 Tax=Desulfatirhabdium butyrativorans TaxID=340467 RepID=UPI0004033C67|nr:hypothetical protein [Desulfatirhabdium butyrativorans]
MTPNEVLALAKERFAPLYFNDDGQLANMLQAALMMYQDKAGVMKSVKTSGTNISIATPDDCLEIASVQDAYGRFHECENDGETITIVTDTESLPPFTIWYLVDLQNYDTDTDLPGGVAGTILEYLIALIDIPNTKRARAAAQATGRQIDLPSDEELLSRKLTIEADMADSQAFLPMMSVF